MYNSNFKNGGSRNEFNLSRIMFPVPFQVLILSGANTNMLHALTRSFIWYSNQSTFGNGRYH